MTSGSDGDVRIYKDFDDSDPESVRVGDNVTVLAVKVSIDWILYGKVYIKCIFFQTAFSLFVGKGVGGSMEASLFIVPDKWGSQDKNLIRSATWPDKENLNLKKIFIDVEETLGIDLLEFFIGTLN